MTTNQDALVGSIGHAIRQVQEQIKRLQAIEASLKNALSYAGEQPPGAQPGPGTYPEPEAAADGDPAIPGIEGITAPE